MEDNTVFKLNYDEDVNYDVNVDFDGNPEIVMEQLEQVFPYPGRKSAEKKRRGYFFLKRVFDLVVSILALILLSPLLLIISVAIKVESKGPVIFKQTRIGKYGKPFTFYKFRSMVENAEEEKEKLTHLNEMDKIVFKIKDDPRVTKIGKFIRKTSIDELPQLINIIKSEMSIVGPRPPLPAEVEKYNEYQKQRLLVKGGLTCFWQVNGRSNVDFDKWVELDLKYIKEMSSITDIKILMKTFGAVLRGIGAV